MFKQLLILIILLSSIGLACAGEIVKEDQGTVFIYGEIADTVFMSSVNDEETNYNRTICTNATVIEGEINIAGTDNYELEYTFIADINDSVYISRILIIKQELISSGLLSGKLLNRTLSLDGIVIGNYESKTGWFGKTKKNTVYYNLIDNNIRFGKDIIVNESLAFTQLNYQDQQDYLPNVSQKYPSFPISHKYISVGADGSESSLKLTGLTGIFYNVFGDTILTKIPFVGNSIASFGKSIQSLIFIPLTIIQFTFDLIFTFLFLIINNWWYGLLVLEIICIIPALKYNSYPKVVGTYIEMHVKAFNFMYHIIILPTILLIFRIIEIIRNMFRI